jgi:hypothetical protein
MIITPATLARITAGYLECVAWADAPDGTYPRFPAAERARALADCTAFVAACGPLADQALALQSPERFGHDFWLTRRGHGAGYWDRDELEVQPDARVTTLDRDGTPYLTDADELGTALSDVAYGGAHISRFAYAEVYAARGWLYFAGTPAAVLTAGSAA